MTGNDLAGMLLLLTGAVAAVFQRGRSRRFSTRVGWIEIRRSGCGSVETEVRFLQESRRKLIPALQSLSNEILAGSVPEKFKRPPLTGTFPQAVAALNYHQGYHNGQIGLLGRPAGTEGAIS